MFNAKLNQIAFAGLLALAASGVQAAPVVFGAGDAGTSVGSATPNWTRPRRPLTPPPARSGRSS